MSLSRTLAVVLAACLAAPLAGCEEEPPPEVEAKGREETRGIRATEAVGYAGEHMADRIDESLDAADEQARRLREAEAQAAGEAPPEE